MLIIGDVPSPILGQKRISIMNNNNLAYEGAAIVHDAFDPEDSDILAHNANIQNRCTISSPRKTISKRDYENIQSAYSWSESPDPEQSKGFILRQIKANGRKHLRKETSQKNGTRSDYREYQYKSQTTQIQKEES